MWIKSFRRRGSRQGTEVVVGSMPVNFRPAIYGEAVQFHLSEKSGRESVITIYRQDLCRMLHELDWQTGRKKFDDRAIFDDPPKDAQ